jgi:AcrR family transcriptional regulator
MTRIAKVRRGWNEEGQSHPRSYRSELRAQQAEATRDRILDATMRLSTSGSADLSIPAVAREAGVSIPTVYRHFKTKHDLLTELYPHIVRRAGFRDIPQPSSFRDLREAIQAIFDRIDALDTLAGGPIATRIVEEARHASMPRRYEQVRQLVDSVEPKLSEADQDRIARLMVILTMSSALRTWRDHLGLSVDDVADDVEWILQAAVAAATQGHAQ